MISSFLIASATSYQLAQVPRQINPSPTPTNQSVEDKDFDGVMDDKDRCPNIPAKKTLYGCPLFQTYSNTKISNSGIYFLPTSKLTLDITEKRDLKFGDLLKIILKDKKTGTILSESDSITVK